jgi:transcription initiation factor IIF auxiliary subunit
MRGIFKWLSQDGGWADFSEKIRAFLLNKNLSNEPNFSLIHLDSRWTVPLI